MSTVAPTGTPLTDVEPRKSSEDLLGLESLLRPEEREWRDRARTFVEERVLPVVDEDFGRQHFRRELVEEMGSLGMLGMLLDGYG